jgi:hypothetical protein
MALYDPAPRETVVSPDFTIAEFLDWARRKPANERYDYCDSSVCALAQFGLETGRGHLVEASGTAFLNRLENRRLHEAVLRQPETFGALVTRLEALSA